MDSNKDTGGKGDCSSSPLPTDLYAAIRKLPNIVEATNVVLKVLPQSHARHHHMEPIPEVDSTPPTATTSESANELTSHSPRFRTALLPQVNRGGDGSIRVHSLSSNAQVLIPETNKNRPCSPDVPRPRTAFTVPVRRKESRPTTATSARSFMSNTSLASTLQSSINASHAAIFPNPSFSHGGPGSWYSSLPSSSRGQHLARSSFASSMTVSQLKSQDAVKQAGILRKKFQQREPTEDDDYNEWRMGMDDPTEESRDLYELSEMFYYVEKEYIHDQPVVSEGEDEIYKNKYKLLVGRISEFNWDFVKLPTPPGFLIRCRITRSRKGFEGKLYPTYYMHLERNGNPEILLLTAKRRSLTKMQYVISTNPADMSSTSSKCCAGILESNMRGSDFVLKIPVKPDYIETTRNEEGEEEEEHTTQKREWEQFFTLKFESNATRCKGPRSLIIAIPKLKSDWDHCHPASLTQPSNNNESAVDTEDVVIVRNRAPKWSSDSCTYVLNFSTRVQRSSVKNFQLAYQDKDEDLTLLQFGRTSKSDTFILDFSYPFCPLQAFAIAIANFDCKWGME